MDLIIGQQISQYFLRKATYLEIRGIFPLIESTSIMALIKPMWPGTSHDIELVDINMFGSSKVVLMITS